MDEDILRISNFPRFLTPHIKPCRKHHDEKAKRLNGDQLEVYLWISSDIDDCPACRSTPKVRSADFIELRDKEAS